MRLSHASQLGSKLSQKMTGREQNLLLDSYIEQDPNTLGSSGARARSEGVPVWALIGYLEASDGDIERVIRDYEISRDAIRAALIYFHRHAGVIAARIEENRLLRAE